MGTKQSKDTEETDESLDPKEQQLDEHKGYTNVAAATHLTGAKHDSNLEHFLDDLHEKELMFSIDFDEEMSVKNGVETLVNMIVRDTLRTRSFKMFKRAWSNTCNLQEHEESTIFDDASDNTFNSVGNVSGDTTNDENEVFYDALEEIEHVPCNNIVEKDLSDKITPRTTVSNEEKMESNQLTCAGIVQETVTRHSPGSSDSMNVIKVGSIYEGSKNHFPDEFDFITVVGWSNTLRGLSFLRLFHNCLQTVLDRGKRGKYCIRTMQGNHLYFDKYVTARGPASTLQFIYVNNDNHNVVIHVDITPAVRLTDATDHVNTKTLVFKEWFEEIIRRNCCLAVYVQDADQALHKGAARLTVTEYEMHFMTNVLSAKHLKVYKILKYLVNGKDDNESLKLTCDIITHTSRFDKHSKTTCSLSSYVIKTFLFHHHYSCTNGDNKIAPCLLDMLEAIEKHATNWTNGCLSSEKHTIRIRTPLNQELEILKIDTYEHYIKLGKTFRYMKEQLYGLHNSECDYKYEDCHISSWAELANSVLRTVA